MRETHLDQSKITLFFSRHDSSITPDSSQSIISYFKSSRHIDRQRLIQVIQQDRQSFEDI